MQMINLAFVLDCSILRAVARIRRCPHGERGPSDLADVDTPARSLFDSRLKILEEAVGIIYAHELMTLRRLSGPEAEAGVCNVEGRIAAYVDAIDVLVGDVLFLWLIAPSELPHAQCILL